MMLSNGSLQQAKRLSLSLGLLAQYYTQLSHQIGVLGRPYYLVFRGEPVVIDHECCSDFSSIGVDSETRSIQGR